MNEVTLTAKDNNGVVYYLTLIWATNEQRATTFTQTQANNLMELILERTPPNEAQKAFLNSMKFQNVKQRK